MNPSFENGLGAGGIPVNWDFATCEGVGNATVNLDSTTYVDGNYSARVYSGPITNTFCLPTNGTRNVGFTQFRQFLANPVNFTGLTDSPDGFSFWFKLQPYDNQSGMGGFDIRVFGAESTAELDYAFDPDPSLSFANQTGRVGAFLFYGYQSGLWYHFSRDLRADWLRLSLPLTHPFSLVMFEGLVLESGTTAKSEAFWLDDVKAYVGTDPPPPETHYAFFNFTDYNGNNVDNIVRWKLFNETGQEVTYALGENTLPPGPYFVEAYYRAYGSPNRILLEQIHLDTRLNIPLAMFPNSSVLGDYVAFDNSVAGASVNRPYSIELLVTVHGTAGTRYSMIVDVPKKPVLIQGNGANITEGYDWTYDTTLSAARVSFIMPPGGENFTIFLETPQRIPDLSFVDVAGSSLQSKVTFKIVDSRGNLVPYQVGSILSPDNYYLDAYYAGYKIYSSPLSTGVAPVTLEMVPLDSTKNSYLAVNSTAIAVTLSEFSSSRITFRTEGQGPYLVVVNVPKRPSYVEKDGVRIPNWVYNSTSQTVAIETDTQGSFQMVLDETPLVPTSTPPYPYLYIGGVLVGLVILASIGLILWRRRSKTLTACRYEGDN